MYRTAIFILAPEKVQAIAGPLRTKYWPDSQFRIPAHISVLSPFVPYKDLSKSINKLESVCKSITPYEISLNGYGEFPGYTFMKLKRLQDTQLIYNRILSIFPECIPYEGKHGTKLHPHLSVAKFLNEEEQQATLLPPYKPLKFTVDKLFVMFTDAEMTLPWKLYRIVNFGE